MWSLSADPTPTLTAPDTMNSLLIVGDGITVSGNALTVANVAASDSGTNGNNIAVARRCVARRIIGAAQAAVEEIVYSNNGTLTLNAPFYGTRA